MYLTERLITQLWGDDSSQLKRFTAIFEPWPMAISTGTPRGYLDEQSQKRFLSAMDEASAIIDGLVEEIQTFGLSGKMVTRGSALNPTAIFESLDMHPEIQKCLRKTFQ
jgi:hypothetical protein